MSDDIPAEAVTNRDVAKGAGTTLLARLGGVIDLVIQPLYVAMFGLAGYGIYTVLWSAVNLIENVADLGMTSALQRTVPQARTRAEAASALRAALILGVGPCLIVAIVIAIAAPSIAHIFNAAPADSVHLVSSIRLFVWALPLWAFVEIATSALRAQRAFGPEIRLRLFWEQIVRFAIAGGLWLWGMGTMALFYAHLASLAAVGVLSLRLLARYFDLSLLFSGKLIDGKWSETFKAGLAVMPYNIVSRLFGDGPQIVLNAWLPGAAGATAAGLFVIARKISSVVQLVKIAFSYVLAPLASLASRGERASVGAIYAYATRLSIALALPLGATLVAGGEPLLSLFGAEAKAAFPALALLVLARVVEAAFGNAATIQQIVGGYRGQLVGSAMGLLAAAAVVILLMPQQGIWGMSLAVLAGMTVSIAIPLWQVAQFDRLHPFEKPFLRVLARSALVALISYGVIMALPEMPLEAKLALVFAIQLAAIWCSLRVSLTKQDRDTLGKLGQTLRLTRIA